MNEPERAESQDDPYLGKQRAFLQTVIDAIPDVLLVIGTDLRIVFANRAAREMAGGIDPPVCLSCHQLSHHRDQPCAGKDEPCPLRQVITTKAPMTVTHTHRDAEGKDFFVEVTAAPVLDESGEVSYVIEACRDVTERSAVGTGASPDPVLGRSCRRRRVLAGVRRDAFSMLTTAPASTWVIREKNCCR